jgi:hypothetical protein
VSSRGDVEARNPRASDEDVLALFVDLCFIWIGMIGLNIIVYIKHIWENLQFPTHTQNILFNLLVTKRTQCFHGNCSQFIQISGNVAPGNLLHKAQNHKLFRVAGLVVIWIDMEVS